MPRSNPFCWRPDNWNPITHRWGECWLQLSFRDPSTSMSLAGFLPARMQASRQILSHCRLDVLHLKHDTVLKSQTVSECANTAQATMRLDELLQFVFATGWTLPQALARFENQVQACPSQLNVMTYMTVCAQMCNFVRPPCFTSFAGSEKSYARRHLQQTST